MNRILWSNRFFTIDKFFCIVSLSSWEKIRPCPLNTTKRIKNYFIKLNQDLSRDFRWRLEHHVFGVDDSPLHTNGELFPVARTEICLHLFMLFWAVSAPVLRTIPCKGISRNQGRAVNLSCVKRLISCWNTSVTWVISFTAFTVGLIVQSPILIGYRDNQYFWLNMTYFIWRI